MNIAPKITLEKRMSCEPRSPLISAETGASLKGLRVGRAYQLRCGEVAIINGWNATRIWGRIPCFRHLVDRFEWRHDGRRIPVGGKDPYDLVGPAS